MMTRPTFLRWAAGLTLAALATTAGLYLSGCGGSSSMASSSFGWRLVSVQGYGNPDMQIKPTTGASSTGSFDIKTSTPVLQAGVPIFMNAIYAAEVPNVNPDAFTSTSGGSSAVPIGTFSAVWSEVPATSGAPPAVDFNNAVGNTFTDYDPSPSPNVRVTGNSGTLDRKSVV